MHFSHSKNTLCDILSFVTPVDDTKKNRKPQIDVSLELSKIQGLPDRDLWARRLAYLPISYIYPLLFYEPVKADTRLFCGSIPVVNEHAFYCNEIRLVVVRELQVLKNKNILRLIIILFGKTIIE